MHEVCNVKFNFKRSSTKELVPCFLGFLGGDGGNNRGGGGHGGETFFCPVQEPNMGKGGDISGAAWAKNKNGIGGGGAGDGPSGRVGKQS